MGEPSPPEERTIYVANFAEEVTEDLLEELFTQTGPVLRVIVRDVKDTNARFALIEFESNPSKLSIFVQDEASVLFAIELMNGVKLFNKEIQVKPRNKTKQEELYRRKRAEIEERVRSSTGGDRRRSYENRRDDRGRDDRRDSGRDYHRDRSPHRDYDRRNRDRSGGSSSSGRDYQQPRHHRQNDYSLPPPPPPPPQLMGNNSWRGNQTFQNPQNLLPHQLFVNVMANEQRAREYRNDYQMRPPPPPPQHHYQNAPRRQDHYRGSDRHGANHYNGHDNRRY
ncbi:hypothetical protein CAEBREN_15702 [Caenorhabditis brenneri]|uniref:RRM domain-containing protein n=1 Tax=Caenorhabditis brenneri TaxID=135651 RepID=G0NSI1_CAEBE|nr:hypothetical protein CAEBREN_15702 [Caenorhabditis brenneri]